MIVYIVKAPVIEDADGMEIDHIRYVTLDKSKAAEFVAGHRHEGFLWVDGHEVDSGNVTHIF